ncbi:MAG: hypothetical protein IJ566_01510 [Cardiobacteriaceae bacterium]|nr:hypothetical protein [Cardiobacteriaceae bacterium]
MDSSNTIMTAISLAGFVVFLLYMQNKRGGIKRLFAESRNSPQHWGTMGVIVLMIVLLVYFLAKI